MRHIRLRIRRRKGRPIDQFVVCGGLNRLPVSGVRDGNARDQRRHRRVVARIFIVLLLLGCVGRLIGCPASVIATGGERRFLGPWRREWNWIRTFSASPVKTVAGRAARNPALSRPFPAEPGWPVHRLRSASTVSPSTCGKRQSSPVITRQPRRRRPLQIGRTCRQAAWLA